MTTVFSLGNDGNAPGAIAAREAQATATLSRARIFVRAGPQPGQPGSGTRRRGEGRGDEGGQHQDRVDDNLGSTPKMAPEVYRAVIDEAHKRGLRVAVHLFYLGDAKSVLDAGADFIAHSVRDADIDADVIAKMKARGICLCPTLMREVSTYVYESTPSFFSGSAVRQVFRSPVDQPAEGSGLPGQDRQGPERPAQGGARRRQPQHEEARRRRRADRDGHRHRSGRPVPGRSPPSN